MVGRPTAQMMALPAWALFDDTAREKSRILSKLTGMVALPSGTKCGKGNTCNCHVIKVFSGGD